jgi:hypothetical protein
MEAAVLRLTSGLEDDCLDLGNLERTDTPGLEQGPYTDAEFRRLAISPPVFLALESKGTALSYRGACR